MIDISKLLPRQIVSFSVNSLKLSKYIGYMSRCTTVQDPLFFIPFNSFPYLTAECTVIKSSAFLQNMFGFSMLFQMTVSSMVSFLMARIVGYFGFILLSVLIFKFIFILCFFCSCSYLVRLKMKNADLCCSDWCDDASLSMSLIIRFDKFYLLLSIDNHACLKFLCLGGGGGAMFLKFLLQWLYH